MEQEFISLWYFKFHFHKIKLSFHSNQFFLLVSTNYTPIFPFIQVENSDILQCNKHFMGAYSARLWYRYWTHPFFNCPLPMVSGVSYYILPFPSTIYHPRAHYFPENLLVNLSILCLLCVTLLNLPKAQFSDQFSYLVSYLLSRQLNSEFKVLHNVANFPSVFSENDVYLYNAIYYTISPLCVPVNFAKMSSQSLPFPDTPTISVSPDPNNWNMLSASFKTPNTWNHHIPKSALCYGYL